MAIDPVCRPNKALLLKKSGLAGPWSRCPGLLPEIHAVAGMDAASLLETNPWLSMPITTTGNFPPTGQHSRAKPVSGKGCPQCH